MPVGVQIPCLQARPHMLPLQYGRFHAVSFQRTALRSPSHSRHSARMVKSFAIAPSAPMKAPMQLKDLRMLADGTETPAQQPWLARALGIALLVPPVLFGLLCNRPAIAGQRQLLAPASAPTAYQAPTHGMFGGSVPTLRLAPVREAVSDAAEQLLTVWGRPEVRALSIVSVVVAAAAVQQVASTNSRQGTATRGPRRYTDYGYSLRTQDEEDRLAHLDRLYAEAERLRKHQEAVAALEAAARAPPAVAVVTPVTVVSKTTTFVSKDTSATVTESAAVAAVAPVLSSPAVWPSPAAATSTTAVWPAPKAATPGSAVWPPFRAAKTPVPKLIAVSAAVALPTAAQPQAGVAASPIKAPAASKPVATGPVSKIVEAIQQQLQQLQQLQGQQKRRSTNGESADNGSSSSSNAVKVEEQSDPATAPAAVLAANAVLASVPVAAAARSTADSATATSVESPPKSGPFANWWPPRQQQQQQQPQTHASTSSSTLAQVSAPAPPAPTSTPSSSSGTSAGSAGGGSNGSASAGSSSSSSIKLAGGSALVTANPQQREAVEQLKLQLAEERAKEQAAQERYTDSAENEAVKRRAEEARQAVLAAVRAADAAAAAHTTDAGAATGAAEKEAVKRRAEEARDAVRAAVRAADANVDSTHAVGSSIGSSNAPAPAPAQATPASHVTGSVLNVQATTVKSKYDMFDAALTAQTSVSGDKYDLVAAFVTALGEASTSAARSSVRQEQEGKGTVAEGVRQKTSKFDTFHEDLYAALMARPQPSSLDPLQALLSLSAAAPSKYDPLSPASAAPSVGQPGKPLPLDPFEDFIAALSRPPPSRHDHDGGDGGSPSWDPMTGLRTYATSASAIDPSKYDAGAQLLASLAALPEDLRSGVWAERQPSDPLFGSLLEAARFLDKDRRRRAAANNGADAPPARYDGVAHAVQSLMELSEAVASGSFQKDSPREPFLSGLTVAVDNLNALGKDLSELLPAGTASAIGDAISWPMGTLVAAAASGAAAAEASALNAEVAMPPAPSNRTSADNEAVMV